MRICGLSTENQRSPLNIGCKRPVFGWRAEGEEEGIRQEAYRIQVWREEGRAVDTVWDSGWVASSRMTSIAYEGEELVSGGRYGWKVEGKFRLGDGSAVTAEGRSRFETGYFDREDWKGSFIGETADHTYHLYRKVFRTSGKVKRAKLYVCGLGHFECWLNGSRVSDHVLEPGWSDYDKTCFYTAYDVTEFMADPAAADFGAGDSRAIDSGADFGVVDSGAGDSRTTGSKEAGPDAGGNNCFLVKLGDGMFNVPGGRYVYYERSYGKCKLLAQLELEYEDGKKQLVVTDASWKMAPSPIRFCCIYGGEDYDARLWKKEALYADYKEDGTWESAVCVEPPKGKLTAMPMEPMKVMETYAPVSIRQIKPGVWLYDFGRNFSGWVRIRVRADASMAGRKIVMKTGEILYEDGTVNQRVTGEGYAWTYILDGNAEQEFAPDFTYTGFRYVEMTGAVPEGESAAAGEIWNDTEGVDGTKAGNGTETGGDTKAGNGTETGSGTKAGNGTETSNGTKAGNHAESGLPVLVSMTGEFLYPDVEQAGDFKCSNPLFEKIHGIVLQAIKSNTKSYFTDCPHREKLGWLEQTHLIGPSIMYNLDVRNLYAKIEGDMADSQRDSGLVSDICPEYVKGFDKWHTGFLDSPEWGSACILAPWYVYKRYGDARLLERYYEVMKRYLDYLGGKTHHEILHHGLGDWLDIGPCAPRSQNTPVPVVATCIYYYDLGVMKQIAELLGKKDDAEEFVRRMERVFEEYNLQFLDDQTARYANGSQAAQAMSLMAGLVPKEFEEKVVEELKNDVVKRGYAITAGDVGHPYLVAALMKYGMSDILNRMTNITDKPGYGYQVVNGATTLTEDWDGPEPGNYHGSQNHLMLGSIEEWFYGALGGMELIRSGLPFGEIRILPQPQEGVDWAEAWVMHPYGKISVSWKRTGEEIEVQCEVPPNVTAYLEAPGKGVLRKVGSGHHSYCFQS